MNISATSKPIAVKLYFEASLGRGKVAYGFGPDRITTLVSMATDKSHRFIMGENGVATFSRLFFIRSFSNLQVIMTCMRAGRNSKFGAIRTPTAELHVAALERKKSL